ncbi:MAG: cytochrome-c peroxidase [Gemmatimonadetes bacterium]|nr:cytochrome-c peroxidase [Gemmatimonadota bacterium]
MKGPAVAGLVGLCVAASIVGAAIRRGPNSAPSATLGDDVRHWIARDADSLDAAIVQLGVALGDTTVDVRPAFRLARARYKRLEGVVEFYAPALAAAFNSRRMEVDDDDAPPPSSIAANGFPALEDLLWPTLIAARRDSARRLVNAMRPSVARVRGLAAAISPTDAQVIELTRLELVRVSTLGVAGFDAPRTGEAMGECAEALAGVRALYAAAGARWPRLGAERRALDSTLAAAIGYLRAHGDFVAFDRLAYLTDFGEPAARALDAVRRAVNAPSISMRRGLRATVASPYAVNAFDPRAYAPATAPPSSDSLVALGRRLFFNPALSGTGKRSCASCHDPSRAFADGLPKAASVDPRGRAVARNTSTLINAALQPAQFADERAVALEDQIIEVLRSPAEMGSSVDAAARAVSTAARQMTPLTLRQALAAYLRTLVALDSRFDRAVRGDGTVLSAEERRGFNLFMGKGSCGTCHFAPLFGGTTPPLYVGSDVEVIGTPVSPDRPAVLDADSGRARIDHRPEHLRAFKVPSLRNVALTAPYMHHGTFSTLDQVVRFYDGGGGRGAGARIANQTLAADSLHLSARERQAIVAFLGALTDTAKLRR